MLLNNYDVIVVGGGHAGVEAAAAASNMGSSVLLVTMNLQTIAQMSCNPAMGGIAKGQILREIDALGGGSGIITDKTMIQFKMLNTSKGPAMWSPRAQSDRMRFAEEWRLHLERISTLDFFQDTVSSLLIKNNELCGVKTSMGFEINSKAVVLTNGTFLNGLIHIGEKQFGGGRMGDSAVHGITEQLIGLGFDAGRMKTGTPPRVDGRSLDYSKMTVQRGDEKPKTFSFIPDEIPFLKRKQANCYMTYTNQTVHDILKEGFDRSPMFNGSIKSIGPRYCPSIEDKINRFADKDRHQIFVEPEGWDTVEVYVNGFSTSLPQDIQIKAIKEIEGFKNAKIFRPGYAIEYDYFPPTQLKNTLETKLIDNLYFAGQINGTTGYEEAASQGLIAGINAHLKCKEKDAFVLGREEAYIGVLIDDLITKGTEEPYRMFTSRAEYRILLRQDNADERLTPLGNKIGLASDERMIKLEKKKENILELYSYLEKTSVLPNEINAILEENETPKVTQSTKIATILSRPQINLDKINTLAAVNKLLENNYSEEEKEQVEIKIKYQGYIEKEKDNADKLIRLENINITNSFDYSKLNSLSFEAREKLNKIKPQTIGQAKRISGISPSDVSVLLIYMGR